VLGGLLAGTVTDPAGLDAVRADLASVVQQVPGPARVPHGSAHAARPGRTGTAAGASDHSLIVASMLNQREGRMTPRLACGTGAPQSIIPIY
jgi:hypothetical protein